MPTIENDPLLTQLLITRLLGTQPETWSTRDLRLHFDISERQVKRHIAEARHMGAEIVSGRHRGMTGQLEYVWTCTNWADVSFITERWIELQQKRDLRSPGPLFTS